MTDQSAPTVERAGGTETGVAAIGTVASIAALFSAAACCILPLALAGLGVGAGGLAAFVPYRWPLTTAALVVVVVGWALYVRKRRACVSDGNCSIGAPSKATFTMLSIATLIVALSTLWGFIEQPLMRALGGA